MKNIRRSSAEATIVIAVSFSIIAILLKIFGFPTALGQDYSLNICDVNLRIPRLSYVWIIFLSSFFTFSITFLGESMQSENKEEGRMFYNPFFKNFTPKGIVLLSIIGLAIIAWIVNLLTDMSFGFSFISLCVIALLCTMTYSLCEHLLSKKSWENFIKNWLCVENSDREFGNLK